MTPMSQTLEALSPAFPDVLGQPTLEAVSLAGKEGVNSLFEYVLMLQAPLAAAPGGLVLYETPVAEWDFGSFLGKPVNCNIQLHTAVPHGMDGAGWSWVYSVAEVRQINALISRIEPWGQDGERRFLRVTLRPWLHEATLRGRCRIFEDLTAVQVLRQVLSAYAYEVEERLIGSYLPRVYRVQFNESDFDFFCRLAWEHGINYWFEHAEGRHRLVLADHVGAFRESDAAAYRRVELHPAGWRADAEFLYRFAPSHEQASNGVTVGDHDYLQPNRELVETFFDSGVEGREREITYWNPTEGGSRFVDAGGDSTAANDPAAEGLAIARLRLEALQSTSRRASASGNLRGMVPGRIVTVVPDKHLPLVGTSYLVLSTDLKIENAARVSRAPGSDVGGDWKAHVDMVLHPVDQPLRPGATRARPVVGGVHTAVVVGPEGESVWTDALGRILVRMRWYGKEAPEPQTSCWLRVQTGWAGNQMGMVFVPRIGQEVLVGFVDGDSDRPYCAGMVPNSYNRPPWDLPGQLALSGVRSRELGADGAGNAALGRGNHLVFDDTEGQLQVQLKSDHLHSQLTMGHLVRIEDQEGRKDARGQGFELRTDGHGVLRAAAGLLITTVARLRALGHAKALDETAARLDAGRELQERLARSALQAGAQQPGDQDAVARGIAAQNDEIIGTGPTDRYRGVFPELSQSQLLLASAAGLSTSSTGDTHIASAGNTALSSAGHTSVATGEGFLVSAAKHIRLFAYKQGLKLVAAGGDIDIAALKSGINLLSRLNTRMQGDCVYITATKDVLINGGGSYLHLNAMGITVGTAGVFAVHSGNSDGKGPDSRPVDEGVFAAPTFDPLADGPAASEFSS